MLRLTDAPPPAAGGSAPRAAAPGALTVAALASLGAGAIPLGAAVNAAALCSWLQAKTGGIGFVDGLETAEGMRFADALAAAFALAAVAGALMARRATSSVARPALTGVAAVATVALVIPGMVATASHPHGHGHGMPYTATLPVDLSGAPGVTEQEVAEAEALVTDTLRKLPRFADVSTIAALGTPSRSCSESLAWRVAEVRDPRDDCPAGTFRLRQRTVPMVHVWITPHRCGPFAALEGDGAGQIKPGARRLCDHAHALRADP